MRLWIHHSWGRRNLECFKRSRPLVESVFLGAEPANLFYVPIGCLVDRYSTKLWWIVFSKVGDLNEARGWTQTAT